MVPLVIAMMFFFSVEAFAGDAPLALVVAVGPGKAPGSYDVTLKVEKGAFFNDTDIEVLSGAGKAAAKLKLPSGIDMLMKGDQVKGNTVTVSKSPAVGDYISEPNGYANHAAAQADAGGAASAPVQAGAPASKPAVPANLTKSTPCPYTAQELSAALGMKLVGPKGSEMPFSGGLSYSCSLGEEKGFGTVFINQTIMPHDVLVASEKESSKFLAGKATYIPNDPDLAKWQTAQGDLSGVVLHYIRKGIMAEIRVMPGHDVMKDKARVEDLRNRVLKLRRLPLN